MSAQKNIMPTRAWGHKTWFNVASRRPDGDGVALAFPLLRRLVDLPINKPEDSGGGRNQTIWRYHRVMLCNLLSLPQLSCLCSVI